MIHPEKTMKVGEIAKLLDVDPNTIRNWCKRYAPYLSPTANPPTGNDRYLSARDYNVLAYIQSAVNGGLNHHELVVKLGEMSFNDGEADIIIGLSEVLPPQAYPTPQEGRSDALMVQEALSTMRGQIEALRRTQQVLLSEALRWGMLLGSIVTLAAAAFLVWVLWLVARG